MGNRIELITKYSTEAWDKVYKQDSRSRLLDGNSKLVKFDLTNAKVVKIGKFTADGLSNYRRANEISSGDANYSHGTGIGEGYGYAESNMAFIWETFEMKCDRAAQYRIDLMDNEETDALAVGTCTTEVSRTIMIPEIDAYCFSTLATDYYGAKDETSIVAANPTPGTSKLPVDALNDGLLYMAEHEVNPENQIIFASPKFMKMLRSTNEVVKPLLQGDYKGDVSFLIEKYEGRDIVEVAPNRFKTDIVLGAKGYTFGASAKEIHFMIVAKDAVTHVVKYNKVRVFAPDVVQDYDGYKVNARIYHDVFVPDNKRCAVYVCMAGGDAVAGLAVGASLLAKLKAGEANETVVSDVKVLPNSTFVKALYYKQLANGTATAGKAGTAFSASGWTQWTSTTGSTVITKASSNTHIEIVAIDSGDRIIGSAVFAAVWGSAE